MGNVANIVLVVMFLFLLKERCRCLLTDIFKTVLKKAIMFS